MEILNKIGSVIIAVGLTIGGWFSGTPPVDNLGGSTSSSDVIALFETTLASRITDTATTMTLTSATDKDGNTLASSTYGMIIDEGTASEEIVLADCTSTTCTNITRGLSVRTGTTTVSALKKEHRRGASVKITDAPALIFATNVFRGKQNLQSLMNYNSDLSISSTSRAIPYASWVIGQTNTASSSAYNSILTSGGPFTATTTFSLGALTTTAYDCQNGANSLTLCSKTYVDSVAVAGASNADTSTKGIVEEATVAEMNSESETGGTGAKLFFTPASFALSQLSSTTVSAAIATSSNASYQAKTLSMVNGDVVMWWAAGYQSNAAPDLTFAYKISGDSATTTVFTANNGSGFHGSGFALFTATTTSTVTIETSYVNCCDNGSEFMYQLTPLKNHQ